MKKIVLLLLLLFVVLSFSACQVNWLGEPIEAPWYVVVPPTVLFIAVVGGISYWIIFSHTYVCPHCNTEIKPKWYQFSLLIHFNRRRLAKCPHCGKRSFCKPKKK
ncbi:MAG: hypothetical protein IKT43_04880 [Clostridia bacterium]|nr:hypothetical protein [Clostridia bacterium]